MAVRLLTQDEGKQLSLPMAASTTVSANSFVKLNAAGYIIPQVAADTEVYFKCHETKTSGASENPEVLVTRLDSSILMEVDTSANTAQSQVGDKVDLSTDLLVNNAATSTGVVEVVKVIGSAANRKLWVRKSKLA